ncbi:MAG TPA: hypothetical protein VE545_06200, partial [Candidatus Dormibacteraeota bacterium]|nr:hypothetical protein [Candidatus Dormibacteraeota bacterium]
LLAGSAFASGTLLLPSYAAAQNSGTDSVADAARKAREAKKAAPSGKKVYTDDDVKPATPSASAQPTSQAGSEAAPAATGAQAQGAPPPADGTQPAADGNAAPAASSGNADDEKEWRDKFRKQREQIARLEKELDVLQREQDKAQIQYYPDPDKALSEGYSRKEIDEKDTKIVAKKDEIAQAKQALSDLEDELRKSGGDPGWSRE